MAKAASAKRYAQALFELAQQQRAAEAWQGELNDIARALSDETIASFLESPRAKTEDKMRIVSRVTAGRDPMIAKFVGLLTERQGLGLIRQIVEEYGELLNQAMGRVKARVTSATAMTSAQERKLRETLGSALQKEIVLETQQDPDIIGGLVVRVGDQIIDGSVRTKLATMKQRLVQGSLR